MIEAAYVRFRESLPDNQNTYAAAEGFAAQGVPVFPFYGFSDIPELHAQGKLTERTIVCGNIGDVHEALRLLGKPVPPPVDYPEHLEWLLKRRVWGADLGSVRARTERCFVKPKQHKLFTGLVWDPADPRCRLALSTVPDEAECWVSDVIEIVSEWRCFVRDGELVGVKHYKGRWDHTPSEVQLQKAVRDGRGKMPRAYSLDLGVTLGGHTLLVEANEGYALGSYGLASAVYTRFLEARWLELVGAA